MTARPQRRCDRCGARLARDNTLTRCTSCSAAEGVRRAAPPPVPAEFWRATEAMRSALASRHIGRVIRAYRTHPHHGRHPLAQETAAAWLGVTQPTLSRIENGPRVDQLDQLIHWAGILGIPARYLWFALPDEHEAAVDSAMTRDAAKIDNQAEASPARHDLGLSSASRTKTLVAAVQATDGQLRYVQPDEAIDRLREFLESSARVYVIKGAPGRGKTRFTYHAAEQLSGRADVQLHSCDSWDLANLDLATEILRYGSIPGEGDSLLRLEQASADLRRPCLVIIDGLKAQDDIGYVGRQLDTALRQVTAENLRFALVVRTPPDIDLAAYPLLAASVYEPRTDRPGASYWMSGWRADEAREAWNGSRAPGEPTFSELPASIQHLATLPLYMHLIRIGGYRTASTDLNAYQLVDACVRSILSASGLDVERALRDLTDIAQRQVPGLIPEHLGPGSGARTPADDPRLTALTMLPLIRTTAAGQPVFDHDVLCEYVIATQLASLLAERGRSAATVTAFNELAERASTSATARGVFEFVVQCLDNCATDLLVTVALSPTVSIGSTLPLMLRVGADGLGFTTDEVLRACARRCSQDNAAGLARSLLATPAVTKALGDEHAGWLAGLLRRFGSAIWSDAVRAIEESLDAHAAGRLLAAADLRDAREATFFARHFFLFFGDDEGLAGSLPELLDHPDWRVRAALAEGLRDDRSSGSLGAESIVDRLAQDPDYKVRAAVAQAVGRLAPPAARRYLATLLADRSWHVRGCVLHGVLAVEADSAPTSVLGSAAVGVLASDDGWRRCPAQIAPVAQRLLLLHGAAGHGNEAARRHALFVLLRESRTGWSQLPDGTRESLLAEARACSDWLVRREVLTIDEPDRTTRPSTLPPDAALRREAFRRLRGRRSIQVALDLHDLDHAAEVAIAAAAAGVEFIEVGDPLIKKVGIAAVEHIKRAVPDAAVVAEMMSADWGRDQVELAAAAGADVVLLIGPATTASVSAAVDAGRRLGVPILLDVPPDKFTERWVREAERAGIDGLAVTTNIDLGVRGDHPLGNARAIRSWTRLPVAVSGGFGPTDYPVISSSEWDVLIVGRSITESVEPAADARELVRLIHRLSDRGTS